VIRAGVAPRRLVRILLQAEHVPPDSAPQEARLGRFDLVAGLDSDAAAALALAAERGAGDGVVVPRAWRCSAPTGRTNCWTAYGPKRWLTRIEGY
jgi:hypothetical protein